MGEDTNRWGTKNVDSPALLPVGYAVVSVANRWAWGDAMGVGERGTVAAALLPVGTVPVERVAAVIAATRLAYDHATKAPPGATYWCRGQLSAGALEQLRRALAAYDAAGPAAG